MNKDVLVIIKHFNGIVVNNKDKKVSKQSLKLLKETINRGFVYSPEVVGNYDEGFLIDLAKEISTSGIELNTSTFYQDWKDITSKSRLELYVDQIMHYFTTYGFEELNIKSDYVYIPNNNEGIEVPDIDENKIQLKVIKGYTDDEIKEKIANLLKSGIALNDNTKKDITYLTDYIEDLNINAINNKEIKMYLYALNNEIPHTPIEFLRYCVYTSTNETLLIKNDYLIEKIKESDNIKVYSLFNQYKEEYGLEVLAEIFNRFKPIFLAFRTNKGMRTLTNKISKLSKEYHKPMKIDLMNEVVPKIKKSEIINSEQLNRDLKNKNAFRKIRLLNALRFRIQDSNSIVYRIRNGKTYIDDFESFDASQKLKCKEIIERYLMPSLINDLKNKFEGKKVYIPDYIDYPLPTTERQFIGNFPNGTSVVSEDNLIAGVYWNDYKNNCIDLDLSFIFENGNKIGWNSNYYTKYQDIIYSGDMTDAKDGASELIYFGRGVKETSGLMYFNFYNYISDLEVPYELIIANEKVTEMDKGYMVDPNNIIVRVKTKLVEKQNVIGVLDVGVSEKTFYLTNDFIFGGNVATNSKNNSMSREYMLNSYRSMISLKEMLLRIDDVEFVDKEEIQNMDEEDKDAAVDLSLENIDKNTFINMFE